MAVSKAFASFQIALAHTPARCRPYRSLRYHVHAPTAWREDHRWPGRRDREWRPPGKIAHQRPNELSGAPQRVLFLAQGDLDRDHARRPPVRCRWQRRPDTPHSAAVVVRAIGPQAQRQVSWPTSAKLVRTVLSSRTSRCTAVMAAPGSKPPPPQPALPRWWPARGATVRPAARTEGANRSWAGLSSSAARLRLMASAR